MRFNKKGSFSPVMLVMLLFGGALLYLVYSMASGGEALSALSANDQATTKEPIRSQTNLGEASTVEVLGVIDIMSGVDTETFVYPTLTVLNSNNERLVRDSVSNISTVIGDTINIYGTGASYYVDPVLNYDVKTASELVELTTYDIVEVTDLNVTAYDDTGSTELTVEADADSNNQYVTSDLGAGQEEVIYLKQEVKTSDEVFRLGAILTYHCGAGIDDFTMQQSGWKQANLPSGDLLDTFLVNDTTGNSTSCTIKHVYEPSNADYIQMLEWEDTGNLKFVIEADGTTAPDGTNAFVGAIFVDSAYEKISGENKVVQNWYKMDGNAQSSDDVGLDENAMTTGYDGGQVGVAIRVA